MKAPSKMRNRLKIAGVAALSATLMTACLPANDGEGSATAGATGAGATQDDQRLVLAQPADLVSLDPHDQAATPAERVLANVFSRLFALDQEMTPIPDVATDYEQVDDLTWRIMLRDDVTFHDGTSLDAHDVAFSINRSANEETLEEYIHFNGIEEVIAIDDYVVEVKTKEPMPTLLRLLAKSGGDIIPADLVEEIGIDDFIKDPVGSGPYKIVEWKRDDRIALEAFEDYFGDEPTWREVEFRTIPEASTRVGELLAGGVDIITDIPPADWNRLESEDGVEAVFGDTTRVMMLVLRSGDDWVTSDKRVREAIDLAIDNEAITEGLFGGAATPVRSRVPLGVFGSNPELEDTYLYDPDRARELVEEVGSGEPIKLHLTASKDRYPLDSEVAEMVVSMLEEVGFDVQVEVLEGATYSEAWADKSQKEMMMIGLADGLMDAKYSMGHYRAGDPLNEGRADYVNEEVTEMILKADQSMDQAEREKLYQEALAIIAEERPHVFLHQLPAAYGVSESILFDPRLDDRTIFNDIKRR